MHTKEPWAVGVFQFHHWYSRWSQEQVGQAKALEARKIFSGCQPVAFCERPEDAARIAACVNACKGLDTIALRAVADLGGLGERLRVIRGLMEQNTELLAALEPFTRFNSSEETIRIEVRTEDVARARAAIAKAKGGVA